MTTSVYVAVPDGAASTAEVATVERRVGGEVRVVWTDVVKAGENRYFSAHDGASIVVAENPDGALADGHVGLIGVFAFRLRQIVGLVGSDERGIVIGRADYAENGRSYLVRYRAGDGRLTEQWWNEPAIAAVGTPGAPDLGDVAAGAEPDTPERAASDEAGEPPVGEKPDPAADAGTEAPTLQA